jgi:EmrB/QacA subfamily drug resistance transporter
MTSPTTAATGRSGLLLAVAVVAQALILLDSTILNIAVDVLSDPARGLGADSADLAWAISAYSLMFAALTFPGGALTDRFGPATVLVAGLSVLTAASLVAAAAPNAAALIFARAAMGAGSGLVAPATLALATLGMPARRRARAVAAWSSAAAIAVAVGPVLGGLLLAWFSWPAVFLVNVPVAAACATAVVTLTPRSSGVGRRPLDPVGMALSAFGLGCLTYGVIDGGRSATLHTTALPLLVGSFVLGLFVLHQLRTPHPGFEIRLFAERRFAGGASGLLVAFACLAGQLFYCAFYLQGVHRLTTWQAGFVMVPAAAGILLGNRLCTRTAEQVGLPLTVLAGLGTASLTYAAYLFFDASTPLAWITGVLFAQGAGIGLVSAPVTADLVARLPVHQAGAGAACAAILRPLGSTLGVAVLGTVLGVSYRAAIQPSAASLRPDQQARAMGSAEGARAAGIAPAADAAYLHAMHVTAGWTALISAAACLLLARSLRAGR